MQVGIIGTGNVGSALATGLMAAGHDVVVGSRDPASSQVEGAAVDTQRAAAEHGAVVVLALPARAVVDVASDLEDALSGKPLIDATNEYPAASTAVTSRSGFSGRRSSQIVGSDRSDRRLARAPSLPGRKNT